MGWRRGGRELGYGQQLGGQPRAGRHEQHYVLRRDFPFRHEHQLERESHDQWAAVQRVRALTGGDINEARVVTLGVKSHPGWKHGSLEFNQP